MSWFKPKASQEDFEYLVKMVQTQKAEIIRLEGKVQALDTALSLFRVRVTELENLNKPLASYPLAGTPTRHQEDRTPQHYSGHSNATQMYHTDSFPDLSTVMLVSALVSDSGPSHNSSYDSSSSSSYDSSSSSSSCGGE